MFTIARAKSRAEIFGAPLSLSIKRVLREKSQIGRRIKRGDSEAESTSNTGESRLPREIRLDSRFRREPVFIETRNGNP